MTNSQQLCKGAVDLLKELIAIPSFSREEEGTARLIESYLHKQGVHNVLRYKNNIVARNKFYNDDLPTILLNSHHDTVKPAAAYIRDPFVPSVEEGKLFGLGSNDAGGCLVSLMAAFLFFYSNTELPFNLIFAATAEEEISGKDGIAYTLPFLPTIDAAIVGEPTLMQMAVAERGLLVVDAIVQGVAGHAARNEGENAIYKALKDITWLQQYEFERISSLLGSVTQQVTVIETDNKAHNVVPDLCKFTIDIRLNECYSHEQVMEILEQNLQANLTPRSMRLRSSIIPLNHPLVVAGSQIGMSKYGSPTLSDKALIPFPALKLGPGDSARSHMANEFIFLKEIADGIDKYIELLSLVRF